MAWFKVDDKLWGHPKWLAASPAARALWVTAGSYCSDHLTDGIVEKHVLPAVGGRAKEAKELVDLGFWELHPRGWTYHDWSDYQLSREHVEAERKAARERQAKAREAARMKREQLLNSAGSNSDSHAVTSPELPEESRSPRPDPTRPDPTVVPTELPKENPPTVGGAPATKPKGSRIPEDFAVTESMRAWANKKTPGFDVDSVTDDFVDYWVAKTGPNSTKADWPATWRRWIRSEYEKWAPASNTFRGNQPRMTAVRSTTDERVAPTFARAAQVAAEEQAEEERQHRLEITA